MIRLTDSARASLAVLSTFVIGIVVGCGVDRTLLSAQQSGLRDHEEVLAELTIELRLTPEQTARVQQIFRARQTEIDAAWAQVHENLRRAMQQTTAEIETVLDSAQVQRLRAWIEQRHGSASDHRPGRHAR